MDTNNEINDSVYIKCFKKEGSEFKVKSETGININKTCFLRNTSLKHTLI